MRRIRGRSIVGFAITAVCGAGFFAATWFGYGTIPAFAGAVGWLMGMIALFAMLYYPGYFRPKPKF